MVLKTLKIVWSVGIRHTRRASRGELPVVVGGLSGEGEAGTDGR